MLSFPLNATHSREKRANNLKNISLLHYELVHLTRHTLEKVNWLFFSIWARLKMVLSSSVKSGITSGASAFINAGCQISYMLPTSLWNRFYLSKRNTVLVGRVNRAKINYIKTVIAFMRQVVWCYLESHWLSGFSF